jgi:succinate dehydrogenase/fumarate reductase-like Fe-S protein
VRTSTGARYRQWLTHKLAGWVDQFGVSGCVGCGRCIAWCPAAIDLTAEVEALHEEAALRGTRTGATPADH